jgi:hypothetical protein
MKQYKFSKTTIQVITDNTHCHIDTENPSKEFLKGLCDDLQHDYNLMLPDFGKDDKDVKKYATAIKEIQNYLKTNNK